jgi:mannose-6-phosphate isomerase-like protein (cupin superfamily)
MQYSHIQKIALENADFRRVLFTNQFSQVVLMSIQPGEEIGEEVHTVDQILFFVQGKATAMVNGEEHYIVNGDMVDIPAGTKHNFINTGTDELKLFSVYAPPEHKDGKVHHTKADAENDPAEH